jgi:20S proteasome subunit beta 7
MRTVGKSTIVGGSGDMADFDSLAHTLEEIEIEYDEWADGHEIQPKSVHQTVTRIMYNRRTKMDPLWNTLVVGGFNKDGPYLGYCDKVGVAYTDDTMASGYGAHIALPIIRSAYEANPEMTEEEATKLMNRCLNVMFYRDARTFNRYQIAIANANGVSISEPYSLETNWTAADMVIPIP